ncbi:50S ribosomal protein L44e [Candidatus Woesearchaeota archaeon]|nr:50S ribosomal protein L44e [Candidatus Woesearchaeota archaeon]
MKVPKTTRRLCPYCKKHTEHKVTAAKRKGLNATNTLTRGSVARMRARGERRGVGNQGKTSRPPVQKRKMSGKKQSKRTDFRYECTTCKKIHTQRSGVRTKRLEFI